MKKMLLLTVLSIVSGSGAAQVRGLDNAAIRRAVARDMLDKIKLTPTFPIIHIATIIPNEIYNKSHLRAHTQELENAFVAREDILRRYLELALEPTKEIDDLVTDIYSELLEVTESYAQKKSSEYIRISWQWRDGGELAAQEGRQDALAVALKSSANVRKKLTEREGDSDMLAVYSELSKLMSREDRGILADLVEFYRFYPEFNFSLSHEEAETLLGYNITNLRDLSHELGQTLSSTLVAERNLHKLLDDHIVDGFGKNNFGEIKKLLDTDMIVMIATEPTDDRFFFIGKNSGENSEVEAMREIRRRNPQGSTYLSVWWQDKKTSTLGKTLITRVGTADWQKSATGSFDASSLSRRSKLTVFDLYNRSILLEYFRKHYDVIETTDSDYLDRIIEATIQNLLDNPNIMSAEDKKKIWDVTWEELRRDRFIESATGEFLATMGWSWQEFGELVYPHNEKEAVRFITEFAQSEDIEKIISALQNKKKSSGRADIIENFISELPHLGEKNDLILSIRSMKQNGSLTDNQEREKLLNETGDKWVAAVGKWGHLVKDNVLASDEWYVPSLAVVRMLRNAGIPESQLQEHILTETIFTKLLNAEIPTEQELNAMRGLLDKEKLAVVLKDYEIDAHLQRILALPLTIQLEGFVRKFIHDTASNRELGQTMAEVQRDDIFWPLAKDVVRLSNQNRPQKTSQDGKDKRKKRRRNKQRTPVLNELRKVMRTVDEKMFTARKEYLIAERDHLLYFIFLGENNASSFFKIGHTEFDPNYLLADGSFNAKLFQREKIASILAPGRVASGVVIVRVSGITGHDLFRVALELYGPQGSGEIRSASAEELAGITGKDGIGEWVVSLHEPLSSDEISRLIESVIREVSDRLTKYGHVSVTPPKLRATKTQVNNTSPRPSAPVPKQKVQRKQLHDLPLEQQVARLASRLQKKGLPSNTPVWMRLRALMKYLSMPPDVLSKEAEIEPDRLTEIISVDTKTIPTAEELSRIEFACRKQAFANKKRRGQMLTSIDTYMRDMRAFIAKRQR